MKKILIMILIGFISVACQPKQAQSIFDNSVCKPPCWQNVTPGITTKKDAITIFSKIAATSQPLVILNNSSVDGFDNEIRFSPAANNEVTVFVRTLSDQVSLLYFERKIHLDVQHAIELFGLPQNVLVIHTNLFDQITLVNASKGIAIGWQLYGGQSLASSELKPSTQISQIVFFDPKEYERVLDSTYLSGGTLKRDEIKNNLRPWNGYGSFEEKYWPPAIPSSP